MEGCSQEFVFDSSDSEEEFDPSPHEDICPPGAQGVQKVWQDRYRAHSVHPDHGRDLIHLFPSKGDKPPLQDFFSALEGSSHKKVPNPMVCFQEFPDLVLNEEWSLRQRWESLSDPPDHFVTDMAVNGITLLFKKVPPPLDRWKEGTRLRPASAIQKAAKTSSNQIPFLKPFIVKWLEQGIVTDNIHEIPDKVYVSRLFHVPKAKDKFVQSLIYP